MVPNYESKAFSHEPEVARAFCFMPKLANGAG